MKRIMVVDDDPMICQLCQKLLTESGYATVTQPSGIRCMSYLRDFRSPDVHLIILDVEMPFMNGFKTLTAIRQSHNYSKIPVIFLTSSCTSDTVSEAIKLGVNDYLKKPFGENDLIRRVQKLIGGGKEITQEALDKIEKEIEAENEVKDKNKVKDENADLYNTEDMFADVDERDYGNIDVPGSKQGE